MIKMTKLENKYIAFATALDRLKEAIDLYQNKENTVLLDGTIQRFEFCVELGWKLLKEYLEYEKVGEFNSPRATIKECFNIGLIENADQWLDMLDDRNLTSHTYDEETAKEIYRNIITEYYDLLVDTKNKVKSVIKNDE
jgi:nucleotidyltransferase substrate binding protein (TIGR01987 family)